VDAVCRSNVTFLRDKSIDEAYYGRCEYLNQVLLMCGLQSSVVTTNRSSVLLLAEIIVGTT
jgi:hypothetical protein